MLALRGVNGGGPAGLLLAARLGTLTIGSGRTWLVSDAGKPGWERPGFDPAGWQPAWEIGPVPMLPWGEVGGGPG